MCDLNFQVTHKVGLTVVIRASYETLLSEVVVGTVPAAECCLSSALYLLEESKHSFVFITWEQEGIHNLGIVAIFNE